MKFELVDHRDKSYVISDGLETRMHSAGIIR